MRRVSSYQFAYQPQHRPVEVTIDANAIEFLIATGWLDEEDSENPFIVGAAIQDWIDFQATLWQ
jgi:hypothetical protein